MTLHGGSKVWDDVLDDKLDEIAAPSLGKVVMGKEHELYTNPELFFPRTLITEKMASLIRDISDVLGHGNTGRVIVLSALFGGGKTHTLISIYHTIRKPGALLSSTPENHVASESISNAVKTLQKARGVDVIVVDGYFRELAPTPLEPLDVGHYKIKTLWGYLAHKLGRFELVRELDAKLYPPSTDTIIDVLKNKTVLILVDEIAEYIKRLYSTPDETSRGYAENVISFMSSLAQAITTLRGAVLVVTLPVEIREKTGEVKVDKVYSNIQDMLEKLVGMLRRYVSAFEEPVAPSNIPALLKTRIFEKIDEKTALSIQDALSKDYAENEDVFGKQYELASNIKKTYPFHPLYIKVILDILDKHEELQKTRDLLRITRKVVREVLRDADSHGLIMPWHIDVTKHSIRNALLTGKYSGFTHPIEEDIEGKTQEYGDKKELAKITALALFASTFAYGGGLVPKAEMLPTERDLALMVYEPVLFRSKGWLPKDVIDASRWIATNLVYVVKTPDTGRMWFTRWMTPIKMVKEIARKVDDATAINELLKHVAQSLKYSAYHKRVKKPDVRVLDVELSKVMRECEPIDDDTRRYIAIACLELPENRHERIAKLEEIIFKTSKGSTRRYANTIYVIYPSSRDRVIPAIEKARELVACDIIEREGLIDKLATKLSVEEAEIAREIYEKKLDEYKSEVLSSLFDSIVYAFDTVAYPSFDESKLSNTVTERSIAPGHQSLLESVEIALGWRGVAKIKRDSDFDFDTLDSYLKRVGVDISDGAQVKTVGEIIDYFYSNPRLPAVRAEVIKEALRGGVRNLKIGLKSRGRIVFKKVYEESDKLPDLGEGETAGVLEDTDQVLPWRLTLEEQLKSLKRREFVDGRARLVEEYYVRVGGRNVPVEEIVANLQKYDLAILRDAPIIKVVREATVTLELEHPSIEIEPEKPVVTRVRVKRVGPYEGMVRLEPETGKLDKHELKVGKDTAEEIVTWIIDKSPDTPGVYQYTIKVVGGGGEQLSLARLTVRVRGKEEHSIEGIPEPGERMRVLQLEIRGRPDLKPLEILKNRLSAISIVAEGLLDMRILQEDESPRIALRLENVKIEDFINIVLSVMRQFSLYQIEVDLRTTIKPRKGSCISFPALTSDEIRELSKARLTRHLSREEC